MSEIFEQGNVERLDDRVDCGEWIECPHCKEQVLVQFKAKTWIHSVETPGEATAPKKSKEQSWRDKLSGQQSAVLDQAIRTGLLESFIAALERGPHNGIPKNKEKYFLEWISMSKRKILPAWALDEFKGLYPGKFVDFLGYNFVGAVLADNEIMLFIPINLINGVTLKTSMNGEKRMAPPDVSGIRQWIKTRMGYVPQEARIFLDETRKRSIGEYANPVL